MPTGSFWFVATGLDQGPLHPAPVSTSHCPTAVWWNSTAGAPLGATPGAETRAARGRHNDVEPVVLGHVDADVGGIAGQGVRLGRIDLGRHRRPVRRAAGWPPPRRMRGRAGRWAPRTASERKSAPNVVDVRRACRARARDMSSDQHDRPRLAARPGHIGAWGAAIGVRDAPVHCTAVRVDQVIPSLASRDAIGVHTLNLRDGLRAAGIDSDIYYGSHTQDVQAEGRPVIELGRAGRDRWLLYQASIGSPVYDILRGAGGAQVGELPQHHPGRPAARLGAGGGLRGRARTDATGAPGPPEPLRRRRLRLQRVRAAGARLRGHRGRPAPDRHALQERRARSRAGAPSGATQGPRGRERPALRREDLAAQGAARPREDARRAPPHRRPGGPPASRRLTARRDLRAGAAGLHRRAGPRPTSSPWPARSAARSSRPTSAPPTSS